MNDNYFIDRETLGKFVDELIKKKALDVNNTEELNKLREESIKALNDEIGMAIFGSFTKEQAAEFNQLLDQGTEDPAVFDEFFKKHNIDEEKIMSDTMKAFVEKFLGGENAE